MTHTTNSGDSTVRAKAPSILQSCADAALIVGGTVGVAAFAYYCFRYAPSADDPLLTPIDAFARYVMVGALPVALFASLLLKPRLRITAAAMALLATAALYSTEILIDLTGYTSTRNPWWSMSSASPLSRKAFVELGRASGIEVDSRDRAEVLDALRERGVDAVPAIMLADILVGEDGLPQFDDYESELLPLGGISRATTVLCNEEGPYVSYVSDEHGFRNPPGVWNLPRADIAAVGQSLTQGYCVPDGVGFVDLLRPQYPGTLNLGVSGESALLQLAAIKEYLPSYAPKTVFWFFYEGQDLNTLYEQSTHPLVVRYLLSHVQPAPDRTPATY